jgi:membrane-bound lytic murein transglycosylase A
LARGLYRSCGLIALALLSLVRAMTGPAASEQIITPVAFARIAGWKDDDHLQALAAFRRSCDEIIATGHGFERPARFGGHRADWLETCAAAARTKSARRFFETHFTPMAVHDPHRPDGLFTGYYEPEVEGRRTQSPGFDVPIYGKPDDLITFDPATEENTGLRYGRLLQGKPAPYFTREEIENGALRGRGLELAWLPSWVDAFFIHIQGSGRIRFPDGTSLRLAYAAKSGLPYTGIGAVLVDRGVATKEQMSMQLLRRWMAENPGSARPLMWHNQSFVFFRGVSDATEGLGAPGAAKVALTPLRSLAVDRSLWMFGTPMWIDTKAPVHPDESLTPFRHLMIAQDTGSAIKGFARGDVYWGWGEAAAHTAGHMKSPGRLIVLLPNRVAARLLAKP